MTDAGDREPLWDVPLLEFLRLPVVVEWRHGASTRKLVKLKSTSSTLISRISWAMAGGGALLLVLATFSNWAPRWAEPVGEFGTAVAVVGLVTLNVHSARTPRGRLFWRWTALLLGGVGLGLVLGGVFRDGRWISVVSHLAVGLVAFVLLDTIFLSVYSIVRRWTEGAKYEFVLTIGGRPVAVRRAESDSESGPSALRP